MRDIITSEMRLETKRKRTSYAKKIIDEIFQLLRDNNVEESFDVMRFLKLDMSGSSGDAVL